MPILNIFILKAVEEFCDKISKGDVQFHNNHPYYKSMINYKINFFFLINKMTKRKIEILEKCLNINLDKYKIKNKNIN